VAAPSETYVDPAIAANSGTGTIGDPYGDLQYALDTMTRDSTNGDRVNVKAGTDEILSSTLTLATYGIPSLAAPLIIQGYTAAAGDGGIGGINVNANASLLASTNYDWLSLINLDIYNSTSTLINNGSGKELAIIGCELHPQADTTAINTQTNCTIIGNNIYDCDRGIDLTSGNNVIAFNYISLTRSTINPRCIEANANPGNTIIGNICTIAVTTGHGIRTTGSFNRIEGNSVYSSVASTKPGILAGGGDGSCVLSNAVEGFSGVGGINYDLSGDLHAYGNNASYNGATGYSATGFQFIDFGNNESLSASPFDKSGSDTFANRFTYFAPVNTGNVRGGAYPSGARRDKGAVQHADPAGVGGGGIKLAGKGGGLVG